MVKSSEDRDKLRDSIAQFEQVANIKGISEFIDAFEDLMPMEELASTMVDIIRDTEAPKRERIFCINFVLSAYKFREKNRPELKDEDLEKMTEREIQALLRNGFKNMPVCETDDEPRTTKRGKSKAAAEPASAHPEGDGMGEETGSDGAEE